MSLFPRHGDEGGHGAGGHDDGGGHGGDADAAMAAGGHAAHGAGDCKLEMLWNWNTVDSCFLSSGWKIENDGMMAATCIGVFLLAVLIEAFRRGGKEYDEYLTRQFERQAAAHGNDLTAKGYDGSSESYQPVMTFRVTYLQQIIRALIHMFTYGGGYIVMLLVMYFNGFIILSVFFGAGVGKFLCDWMVVKIDTERLKPVKDAVGI